MCKLFIMTGALRRGALKKTLLAANKVFAETEHDGFGFLTLDSVGKYTRGRYFEPKRFRGFGLGLPTFLSGEMTEENHLPAVAQTLIVHGRTATNTKNIYNVHPFVHGHEALAHNGVVEWIGAPDEAPAHTCDSEQFFQWLHTHTWNEALTHFAGWGAIAHVDFETGVLTVARDGAQLYIAKRKQVPGWIMATKAEHLTKICKEAGIALQHAPMLVPNLKILTFARRGIATGAEDWSGFGARQLTYLDDLSLGLDDDDINNYDNDSYEDSERIHADPRQKRRGDNRRTRKRKNHSRDQVRR